MSLTRQSSLFTAAQNMSEERTLIPAFVGAAGILALSVTLLWPSSKDEEKKPVTQNETIESAMTPENTPH